MPAWQAELFVLTPLGPQAAEPERRKRLVDQRNALIKISNNVAQPVDDELSLDEIECAPQSLMHLCWQLVSRHFPVSLLLAIVTSSA